MPEEIIILLGWNIVITLLLVWLVRKFIFLGKGIKERNVVAILGKEVLLRRKVEENLTKLQEEIKQLKNKINKAVQRVKIVRFNPYNDVGGDQSFVVSLLDGEACGLVLSSLHGREGTRVYAKPVVKGEGKEYSLSSEEKEAINDVRK